MDSNFDTFIDFWPEALSNDNKFGQSTDAGLPPTRIIFVCMLCLRQYELEEDLRGHMIEYHKYVPIPNGSSMETNDTNLELKLIQDFLNAEPFDGSIIDEPIGSLPEPGQQLQELQELNPIPFKEFRLLLRRHMNINCSASINCSYRFETPEKLADHTKCHIRMSTSFKCFRCPMELKNWRKCSAHLWRAHNMDIDLLQCPICDFKSYASALVWRHMRVHKKWRPRVLRSLKAVKKRRLQTQQQVATSQQKQQQEEEQKNKAPPKRNKYYSEKICHICERTFVNGKTLSKHIKTVHNKIKPFICNVCGKKTARKACLIIHMRQHTGEKPLQCKHCKFSTRDPSVLTKHEMRHNRADYKFKCSLCSYSAIQANAYKRHLRLNHPEVYKDVACDLCNFVTISPERLTRHKKDHRKGLIDKPEEPAPIVRKLDIVNEASSDCFLPLEGIDFPHEPVVDTGGVTIPAPPPEDSQLPTNF